MNFIQRCGWSVRITSLWLCRVGQIVNLRADCLSAPSGIATQTRRIWQIRRGLTTRPTVAIFAVCALCWGQRQAAIDHISAASLRTNLSYIASDELEGRNTPSHGLDLAANYIAAQFKRAGLEPGAGDSYFQSAKFEQAAVSMDGFDLTLSAGKHEVKPENRFVRVRSLDGLNLVDAPV